MSIDAKQLPPMDVEPLFLQSNFFSDIDRAFARLIDRLSGSGDSLVALSAALVSQARGEGHTCLNLRAIAGTTLKTSGEEDHGIRLPDDEKWTTALRTTPVVGRPNDFTPLVLNDHGRLYLHRYWRYESSLAQAIHDRANALLPAADHDKLVQGLERLFPAASDADLSQRLAAATAAQRKLSVITGGPGTGKTRTVVFILALLLEQAEKTAFRIALTAPTGKAAARLQEAVNNLKPSLPCDTSVLERLPTEAFTLHRLLGIHPVTSQPRFDRTNPLPYDLVVLDEASMVDLALMAKLFDALPDNARIILLGDKDQLASVEAGAVLGDICHGASVRKQKSPATKSALAECIVQLDKTHRFRDSSGILELSQAINNGDGAGAGRILHAFDFGRPGVRGRELPPTRDLKQSLHDEVLQRFGGLIGEKDPARALRTLGQFRILCALRKGPYGVEATNRSVEQILAEAGMIAPRQRNYAGRPILITRNEPSLKLFNGDIGILLADPMSGGLRAWFATSDGDVRSVIPLRLPEHETAFAMTIHKSQGSEFERVLMILPDRENPLLTRELLYTGITRASQQVELWFREAVLLKAIEQSVKRSSGLRDALWPANPAASRTTN